MENWVYIHSLLQFCNLLCFLGGRRSLLLSISQALGPGLLKKLEPSLSLSSLNCSSRATCWKDFKKIRDVWREVQAFTGVISLAQVLMCNNMQTVHSLNTLEVLQAGPVVTAEKCQVFFFPPVASPLKPLVVKMCFLTALSFKKK